jgi:CheY-like chemotaxis protein
MRGRALIVDDDSTVCDLVQNLLGSTGLEVVGLTSSTEAATLLQAEKFSVVLLDLRMPAPDGFELARQARASGFNKMTPVILISDDQSLAAVSQGFKAGASFFLYKPLDKSRLLKLIRATQGAIEHEQRRFRRVALQSRVRLICDRAEWEGVTIDVSLNGMLVKGSTVIPEGSAVHVSLYTSPDEKPIIGSGSVMRVLGGNRMGIQLTELVQAESWRLQEFLLPRILEGAAVS